MLKFARVIEATPVGDSQAAELLPLVDDEFRRLAEALLRLVALDAATEKPNEAKKWRDERARNSVFCEKK